MAATDDKPKELRLLSLVEALTVTGPVKPILIFSDLMRSGFGDISHFAHAIATTRRPGSPVGPQDELFSAAQGIGVQCIALPERGPFDVTVLPKLRRAIHEFRPHIVETHGFKSHLLFHIVRIFDPGLQRLPWVAFHHGYTRTSWKVLAYQQLDRLTLRGANRIVTLCQPFATALTSRGVRREKISVVVNPIAARPPPSREAVTRARTMLRLAGDEPVILSVGRLSREKGHRDLFAALRPIVEQGFPNIRLVIAGDGPEKRELERLAAAFAANVIFTGQIRDPWPLYHLAQLFVLPSHSEGSPLVILEAMAAGLPIVSTAVGGIPDMLTNRRSALLIPPGSPQDLASAITELLQDESLRIRLAAEASAALIRCSPSAYAKRLLSIYEAATAT